MGLNINATKKNTTVNIALTGLMGALVIVGTFLNIPVPVLGDRTMIGLGNVFCILSGLLLGPIYGGAAAGIGSGVFDLIGGWATSAPTTLINKFMMAFVCGAIAWSGKSEGRKAGRIILGAVSGSLTYCVLYMTKSLIEASLLGNAQEAIAVLLTTKLLATLVNAVIADVVAVPLSIAVRKSLERNKMYLGVVSQAQGRLSRVELHRLLTAVLLVIQAVLQIVCIARASAGHPDGCGRACPHPYGNGAALLGRSSAERRTNYLRAALLLEKRSLRLCSRSLQPAFARPCSALPLLKPGVACAGKIPADRRYFYRSAGSRSVLFLFRATEGAKKAVR